MKPEAIIEVRFYRLSEPLQPYLSALYATKIECPPDMIVKDCLHPEWAALRFTEGPPPLASIGSGPMIPQWPFVANGPTSKAIQFGVTNSRVWGLRLTPAGWSKFTEHPAAELSDRTVDGSTHQAFELFAPILGIVRSATIDADQIAGQIDDYLMAYLHRPVPNMEAIFACQRALGDPLITNVAQLGARLGMGRRSLERLCARYFGFAPKLLLRRERLLRSLARFMVDPRATWSEALDSQYYDQAQFVRDFRAFMGMTPTEYAEAPHPILSKVIAHRMADQGAAPPTDRPLALRYSTSMEA